MQVGLELDERSIKCQKERDERKNIKERGRNEGLRRLKAYVANRVGGIVRVGDTELLRIEHDTNVDNSRRCRMAFGQGGFCEPLHTD